MIARGLAGFDPGGSASEAGRIMLHRLRELGAARADFAFEKTLASRGFAQLLRKLVSAALEAMIREVVEEHRLPGWDLVEWDPINETTVFTPASELPKPDEW